MVVVLGSRSKQGPYQAPASLQEPVLLFSFRHHFSAFVALPSSPMVSSDVIPVSSSPYSGPPFLDSGLSVIKFAFFRSLFSKLHSASGLLG